MSLFSNDENVADSIISIHDELLIKQEHEEVTEEETDRITFATAAADYELRGGESDYKCAEIHGNLQIKQEPEDEETTELEGKVACITYAIATRCTAVTDDIDVPASECSVSDIIDVSLIKQEKEDEVALKLEGETDSIVSAVVIEDSAVTDYGLQDVKFYSGENAHNSADIDSLGAQGTVADGTLPETEQDDCYYSPGYTCCNCNKTYITKSELLLHLAEQNCSVLYYETSDGQKEHSNPAKENSNQCQLCEKCFSRKSELNLHMRTHTEYQCNQCGKCFNLKFDRDVHICIRDKPYQCKQCRQNFSRKDHLKLHMRDHILEKSYQCDLCGECFFVKSNLERHVRNHPGKKPYQCRLCGKSFSQLRSLKYHKRTHTGAKNHRCEHCGKCFLYKCYLDKHIVTHTGEKPYQCVQCEKTFARKGNYDLHMQIHAGLKRVECKLCGKSISSASNLTRHLRIHTGEKPYMCLQCGTTFSYSGDLKKHMRTHTGERPHQCNQCNKSFSRNYHLKIHNMRVHSREKPD